jgi:hypothetical protein
MNETEARELIRHACRDLPKGARDSEVAFLRAMKWLEIQNPELSEAFEMIGLLRAQDEHETRH